MKNIKKDASTEAHSFYKEALEIINHSEIPYLLGGTFAITHFTGIDRETKDLDIFCKASDYTKVLKLLDEEGYETEITDPRWLAKARKGKHFIDIIFNNTSNINIIDDSWIENGVRGKLFGITVSYISAEDLLWSKLYVQNRERYDGADINHIILKQGKKMDWNKVMGRLKQHWQLLLSQILNFQFVYPSDREVVPEWLYNELLERAKEQYNLPVPKEKVCLGPLVDHSSYNPDIMHWGYKCLTSNVL